MPLRIRTPFDGSLVELNRLKKPLKNSELDAMSLKLNMLRFGDEFAENLLKARTCEGPSSEVIAKRFRYRHGHGSVYSVLVILREPAESSYE